MKKLPLLLLFLFPSFAFAHEGVAVSRAWSPPSLSQPNGVGFMTLNASDNDALVNVTSDCCTAVEMHTHSMEGDIMKMRRVDKIELPDHRDVTLAPGGYHLMLIGLKKPLEDGQKVPLKLFFEHAKPVDAELEVDRAKLLEKIQSPSHHGQHH